MFRERLPPFDRTEFSDMRVMVVEDHPAMRFALRQAVETSGLGSVVAETGDADEARRLLGETEHDLLILDLRLEGERTGIELCREAKALSKPPKVLVYTSYNDPQDIYLCTLSGADGFVHKSAGFEELKQAMTDVAEGRPVRLSGRSVEAMEPHLRGLARTDLLSEREREVFALVLDGRSNVEITRDLSVSLPTVKSHVRNILRKLGVENRRELFGTRLKKR